MTYDVSKLKNRIHIYQFEGLSDGAGGKLDNWLKKEGYKKILSRWADVIPLSGKSLYQAKMMQEETTHDVVIRYNKSLKKIAPSSLFIDYKGDKLEVNYILDIDNEHEFIKMRCTENNGRSKH